MTERSEDAPWKIDELTTDDAVLRAMLDLAGRLGGDGDSLMAGQYRHLAARIEALLELRAVGAEQ